MGSTPDEAKIQNGLQDMQSPKGQSEFTKPAPIDAPISVCRFVLLTACFLSLQCDEVRPLCGNCAKHFIGLKKCEYNSLQPIRWSPGTDKNRLGTNALQQSRKLITDGPLLGPALYPRGGYESGPARLLEARLMHHYTEVVCKLMPSCHGEPALDMWARRIPAIAFDSEIALEPVMALSALHLHSQAPDDPLYFFAMSKYLDRTIVNCRTRIPELTPEQIEPLFVSSAILSTIMWLAVHRPSPNEPYKLPLQAYHMIRGVAILFLQQNEILAKKDYGWFGQEIPVEITDHPTPTQRRQIKVVKNDFDDLLAHFNVRKMPDDVREVYEDAASYILRLYEMYFTGVDMNHILRNVGPMPLKVHPAFLGLLEKHDPLAMALLARSLALLEGEMDKSWWLQGTGEYEVAKRDVEGIAGLMPPSAKSTMQWPLDIVSGRVVLSEISA